MGVDEGKVVLLDTNCFIYYMEDHDEYADALEEVFTNIQTGRNNAVISGLRSLFANNKRYSVYKNLYST